MDALPVNLTITTSYPTLDVSWESPEGRKTCKGTGIRLQRKEASTDSDLSSVCLAEIPSSRRQQWGARGSCGCAPIRMTMQGIELRTDNGCDKHIECPSMVSGGDSIKLNLCQFFRSNGLQGRLCWFHGSTWSHYRNWTLLWGLLLSPGIDSHSPTHLPSSPLLLLYSQLRAFVKFSDGSAAKLSPCLDCEGG